MCSGYRGFLDRLDSGTELFNDLLQPLEDQLRFAVVACNMLHGEYSWTNRASEISLERKF